MEEVLSRDKNTRTTVDTLAGYRRRIGIQRSRRYTKGSSTKEKVIEAREILKELKAKAKAKEVKVQVKASEITQQRWRLSRSYQLATDASSGTHLKVACTKVAASTRMYATSAEIRTIDT